MREACFTRLPMVAQKGGLDKEKKLPKSLIKSKKFVIEQTLL